MLFRCLSSYESRLYGYLRVSAALARSDDPAQYTRAQADVESCRLQDVVSDPLSEMGRNLVRQGSVIGVADTMN